MGYIHTSISPSPSDEVSRIETFDLNSSDVCYKLGNTCGLGFFQLID